MGYVTSSSKEQMPLGASECPKWRLNPVMESMFLPRVLCRPTIWGVSKAAIATISFNRIRAFKSDYNYCVHGI